MDSVRRNSSNRPLNPYTLVGSWIVLCASLLTPGVGLAQPPCATEEDAGAAVVTFNHANPDALQKQLSLADQQCFAIKVESTDLGCYQFNLQVKAADAARGGFVGAQPPRTTAEFLQFHKEEVASYVIEVKRQAGKTQETCPNPDTTFTLLVDTYGWSLGFAGAYTFDELTDRVFFLEAGKENNVDGLFVRENKKVRNEHNNGLAAMVHLFHSDPQALKIGGEKYFINWAPITFGLGLGTNSATHYYLGTSIRFSRKVFLTVGVISGPTKRLPSKLDVGSFTTDSNALNDLPTKTDEAAFIGLSYSFLKTDATPFTKPFETAKAKLSEGKDAVAAAPAPAVPPPTPAAGSGVKPVIEAVQPLDKTGVLITGKNFGPSVKVTIDGKEAKNVKRLAGEQIYADLPDGVQKEEGKELKVKVENAAQSSDEFSWK